MKDCYAIRIIYTGHLFQPIKRPYYASNWRSNDFSFSLILSTTPPAQKRLKLALKSILQKLAFREINSPHDFKFSKKSLGKVCLFPLYTNLESLIFPIAPGFSAIFDSHFVYKAAFFVYKKYFFKMQAPPAFVHDLDSFLNTSLYPAFLIAMILVLRFYICPFPFLHTKKPLCSLFFYTGGLWVYCSLLLAQFILYCRTFF